ncbi:MAG TPA: BRCT domain-containing protein [Vicinamibacterales bacterium]|nr:BRCT domain-containing protein [Vicinamibacterales bacterium]
MAMPLDEHGQPLSGFLNRKRRIERDVSELLGLAKGFLCDGVVTDEEASFLRAWGTNHPDALSQWPVSLIFSRLRQFFADGRIDDEERRELHELLGSLVGGTSSLLLGYEGATTLPLDQPPPLICYGPDEVFVFTGKFAFGTRAHCERVVKERGSRCEPNVTRRTTFLVLGTFGSEDWVHTSYGRKIERAVELRASGFPVRIVGEDHWTGAADVV